VILRVILRVILGVIRPSGQAADRLAGQGVLAGGDEPVGQAQLGQAQL